MNAESKTKPPRDDLSALEGKFQIKTEGELYIVSCSRCRGKWSLPTQGPVHVGNILKLLEHFAKHKKR